MTLFDLESELESHSFFFGPVVGQTGCNQIFESKSDRFEKQDESHFLHV